MEKQTPQLLFLIEKERALRNLDPRNMAVDLRVKLIVDRDPGIKFLIYSSENPDMKYEGDFRLFRHNPFFFRRAVRKAEKIASEAQIHYSFQGIKTEVRHYPNFLDI